MSRVKFISYNGQYPNLCGGVLEMEIDGTLYKFGHNLNNYNWAINRYTDEDENNPNFPEFWSSGGSIGHNDDEWDLCTNQGKWELETEFFPEQFIDVAQEMIDVFNENVSWGCCGGCI